MGLYVSRKGELDRLVGINSKDRTSVSNHEIKCTHCSRCGSPLAVDSVSSDGLIKCAFCDSFSYVW